MEQSKYYTPKPEDLHVGFECEIRYFKDFDKKDQIWLPFVIPSQKYSNENNYDYEYLIEKGNLLVKYLDRDDIESLGWKEEAVDSKYRSAYHIPCDMYSQTIKNHGTLILIKIPFSNKITIKHPNFYRDGSGNFDGYVVDVNQLEIKNKSELRKLMSMLGIANSDK